MATLALMTWYLVTPRFQLAGLHRPLTASLYSPMATVLLAELSYQP